MPVSIEHSKLTGPTASVALAEWRVGTDPTLAPSSDLQATETFKLVGDALIPMMLLSLGVRLYEATLGDWHIGVVGGIVCPLTGIAMAALLARVLGLDPTQQGLLILFGSLPPAVLNFMVAEQFGQEPGKVASIVLIGNLLAVLFVPLGLTLALRHQAFG